MTIDEAIKHAEEVASRCEFDTDWGTTANAFIDRSGVADVIECGKEHRQLAEWLKELRAVRKAWTQLTSTVIEIRDNALNADVEKIGRFLVNYLSVLEKGIMKEVEE